VVEIVLLLEQVYAQELKKMGIDQSYKTLQKRIMNEFSKDNYSMWSIWLIHFYTLARFVKLYLNNYCSNSDQNEPNDLPWALVFPKKYPGKNGNLNKHCIVDD